MQTSDFDYHLPPELIAQTPLAVRDSSRLMVVGRLTGAIAHRSFHELPDLLRAGDVLVFNDSRVIPARLHGRRLDGEAAVEVLLLRRVEEKTWEALVKPAKRLRTGCRLEVLPRISGNGVKPVPAEIIGYGAEGIRLLRFPADLPLENLGEVPLPPYIHAPLLDRERYQTVYARDSGSVAAPTAGLHFTPELMSSLEARGVKCVFVTLHIGLDTFRPVREADPAEHAIHTEYGALDRAAAQELDLAKKEGRRVIAVGTTAVRLLEHAARINEGREFVPFAGWVDLFILPGHQFRLVDGMLTNFHLPRSTLIMLVSAFAGRELVLKAYAEAVKQRYRFYSFGDAMLLL